MEDKFNVYSCSKRLVEAETVGEILNKLMSKNKNNECFKTFCAYTKAPCLLFSINLYLQV